MPEVFVDRYSENSFCEKCNKIPSKAFVKVSCRKGLYHGCLAES